MNISRTQLIVVGVMGALILVAFFAGRGCGCSNEPPPLTHGIDAGPGEDEIARRLDAALVAGAAHIEEIEEKFEEDMAAFDEHQREEYERLRGGDDLEEAARFLSDWNRHRHSTSGGEEPRPPITPVRPPRL